MVPWVYARWPPFASPVLRLILLVSSFRWRRQKVLEGDDYNQEPRPAFCSLGKQDPEKWAGRLMSKIRGGTLKRAWREVCEPQRREAEAGCSLGFPRGIWQCWLAVVISLGDSAGNWGSFRELASVPITGRLTEPDLKTNKQTERNGPGKKSQQPSGGRSNVASR